jgi:hypothetical protein
MCLMVSQQATLDNLAEYNLRSKEEERLRVLNDARSLAFGLDARGMLHKLWQVLPIWWCTHPKRQILPDCRNCVFYQQVSLPTLVE